MRDGCRWEHNRITGMVSLLFVTCCLLVATLVSAEEVMSRAAVVMEASTGRILFAKNPNLKLPPASTTKLVTAMIVLDSAQLNDLVTISEEAERMPSLDGHNLKAGETMTVEKLLYAVIVESSNDAAFALAEAIAGSEKKFVELMNKKVRAISASRTRFINTTGLPGRGQRITAYDLAKIMRYALKYPVLKKIMGTKTTEISTEEGRVIFLENTNRLLWGGNGTVGGKTGYTKSARHCFVYAVERENEAVIISLLGAPTRNALWGDAERLAEKGFKVMANYEQPVIYFTKKNYKKASAKNEIEPAERFLKKRTRGVQSGKNDAKVSANVNWEINDRRMERSLKS